MACRSNLAWFMACFYVIHKLRMISTVLGFIKKKKEKKRRDMRQLLYKPLKYL